MAKITMKVSLSDLIRMDIDDLNDEFDKVMTVNVRGVHQATKAAVPAMIRAGGGKIVNIASGTFYYGPPGLSHYTASKGAVIALTRSHARELGDKNIQINAIAPGLTETRLAATLLRSDAMREAAVSKIPLKRINQKQEVAATMQWLLCDAPDNITGQVFHLDGGMSQISG